jgi:hypothetical protein
VSYRSFKHLLGETSLERKCRFIFGGGILVLVSISFYWYGLKTESLVIAQTNQTARILADMKVKSTHNKEFFGNSGSEVLDSLSNDLTSIDDLPQYEANVIRPHMSPGDPDERAVLARFLKSASAEGAYQKAGRPRSPTPSATAPPSGTSGSPRTRNITSSPRPSSSSPTALSLATAGATTGSTTISIARRRGASGSRPGPATWPVWSWSPSRSSRRRRRSITTGPS